ncbi:ras-related protein Rab-33A [Xiphophorus couchianus]|uniref:small monomeric GTPase n=1 Tax=Xiphophorus couchianus TaxID=32473 RepID=A0A3B5M0S3_9TELE|nr:ras-related protein Rab-33A-like [Xiphophorus couchianus]
MTKDSPEEETRAPGGVGVGGGEGGGGGGGGAGRGASRRNRADDNVTILTSSMDFYPAGRSRASSSSDAAPSLTSSLDTSIQTRIFKIIVIGDSNVGKTCLTFRFTGGSFPDKTEATIGVDFREKAVEIEGETIKVQVWDTAGQERFRKSMVEHYYRNVHAVVFVYDVTKMASFRNLQTWIEECNGHRVSASVPRVLVGNKCDLVDQIQVPSNMALKFADSHNMLLFETSAKDPKESQNVDSIFMSLACRLKAQKSLLYRDVEREDGRVRLTQETEAKTNCPC